MLENIFIDNLIQKKTNDFGNEYILKKECIVLGKSFGKEPFDEEFLEINIHKDNKISECTSKIIAYLKWLNGDEFKYKLMGTVEKMPDNNWYEKLELYRVLITVTKDGRVGAEIGYDG